MLLVYYKNKTVLRKHSGFKWIYLGTYVGLEKAQAILAKENRIFIGKDIERITNNVRDNFVDYIGKLSVIQKNRVVWYSSRIASKSVSQTSIFQEYVYLKLLEQYGGKKEDILVVIDDRDLIAVLRQINLRGTKVLHRPAIDAETFFNKLKDRLKILRYFFLWALVRLLRKKRTDKFQVFIHGWVSNKVFANLPKYTDLNLGNLEELLKEKGYSVGRLVPLYLPVKYVWRLDRSFSNVVFPLAYLKLKDFIGSLLTIFSVTHLDRNDKSINDLRMLRALTKNEIAKEASSSYFLNYLMSYYAYKSMGEKADKNVNFIYPFENQPWEKVFNLALEKFNRIGYQHSTIGSNWLDYRVSRDENSSVPLPRTVLTVGKKWSSLLRDYYRFVAISEAGAIRYPYLFDGPKEKISNTESNKIVVGLPISPSISLSMQKLILNALGQGRFKDYEFKIKTHPYLSKGPVLYGSFSRFNNCAFVNGSINSLLADCALFITSSSSVVFESVFSKVKTLYFLPEEVSYGHEYLIRDQIFIAYEEDFIDKLEAALNSHKYPSVKMEEFFALPNLNAFLDFMNAK